MTGTPILVTGGAGYIGAHACKALFESGYLPIVYDNLSGGHRSFARWGDLVEGELADEQALEDLIRSRGVEAVLHLAAHVAAGESVANPRKYYANNVEGTLSLLRAMQRAGCRRIVFSSTAAVYGAGASSPIREDAPTEPANPYGETKLKVEKILADCRAAHGLQVTTLRYFNAAGADAGGEIGELRDPETHLIPRAMMHIQGHIPDFRIFGDNFDTPDGTAIRDYVHVSDLAAALVRALGALRAGAVGGTYNLGSGMGHSVKQVLEAIFRETGVRLVAQGPRRAGDTAILVADSSLARKELRWSPQSSSLDEIVRSAWAWHRKAHPRA